MYYSLLNSSLPYVCIVLHVICYMLYIYMLHMWMWDQTREVCSVRRVVLEWEDFKVIWAMQSLSLSRSLPRPTLHTEMLLQNCSRTMQKGVQPATIKTACNSLLFSTPTALKQHRDQSNRPVQYLSVIVINSDIYQWTVIHLKWQWQWSVNLIHCTVYLVCALCITKWLSRS